MVDQGTGASCAAPEAQGLLYSKRMHTGLVDTRSRRPIDSLMVRLTTDGRPLADPPQGPGWEVVRPARMLIRSLLGFRQREHADHTGAGVATLSTLLVEALHQQRVPLSEAIYRRKTAYSFTTFAVGRSARSLPIDILGSNALFIPNRVGWSY